jgi:hypothetical protein
MRGWFHKLQLCLSVAVFALPAGFADARPHHLHRHHSHRHHSHESAPALPETAPAPDLNQTTPPGTPPDADEAPLPEKRPERPADEQFGPPAPSAQPPSDKAEPPATAPVPPEKPADVKNPAEADKPADEGKNDKKEEPKKPVPPVDPRAAIVPESTLPPEDSASSSPNMPPNTTRKSVARSPIRSWSRSSAHRLISSLKLS